MGRLADSTAARLAIFTVLAAVLVWPILDLAGYANEFRDAQVLALHERAATLTVDRFGELPLWNPYYCGGISALGEPQSRFASPTFLLSLLFGVERAETLVVFFATLLGMEGTYRWLRLRITAAAALLPVAPVFAISGYFAVSFFRGWTNFFGFELVPWILLGITEAVRGRTRGIAIASIAFAVMLGFGGAFGAPLVAIAAIVEALRAVLERAPGERRAAWLRLPVLASFLVTVAAFRLVPLAETLTAAPRIMAGTPGHAAKHILAFLVSQLRYDDGNVDGPGSFFVGWGFCALVVLGAAERKVLRSFVAVVLFLWLAAGYARKPPLFALLRELPVFSALRYPERFLWLVVLYASEPAAAAIARIPRLGDGPGWRRVMTAFLSVAALSSVVLEIRTFHRTATARDLGAVAVDRATDFRQARGNRWLAAHYDGLGVGSLSCWETHPIPMSPRLRGDLAVEEYLAEADARAGASVARVAWSPNAITLRASLPKPGRVFVNQNWHPGWRTNVGEVVSDEGLLAVDLPAGQHDVTLRFRPRSARVGGAVSVVSLLVLAILASRERSGARPFTRRTWRSSAALTLTPWFVVGVSFATWDEPRYPAPTARNADGTLAVAEGSLPDAKRIDATFDAPIHLDAADAVPNGVPEAVAIDLYVRRTGDVPRTTAVLVRVVRRDDGTPPPADKELEVALNADHQVVAASYYVSDLPRDTLVHDAFGVSMAKAAPGTYDVFVGFGHVSGKRGRFKVRSPGRRVAADDLVRIATFERR